MDDRRQGDNSTSEPASGTDAGDMAERKLKPAAGNPWYVLATIHGEQTGEGIETNLLARNRRTWNRWIAVALDDEARQALVEKHGVDPGDLVPFRPEEFAEIQALLAGRPEDVKLPKPGTPEALAIVDFSGVEFESLFVAGGFVFPGLADFSGATFRGEAWFGDATFRGAAVFRGATFRRYAWFDGATFRSHANFVGATLRNYANFDRVTFRSWAVFEDAAFRRDASFRGAIFRGGALFCRTVFKAATTFDGVRFVRSPDFRDAKLPFATTWEDVTWPTPTGEAAKDDRRHYAALRHAMDTVKLHDAELDFFVRELQAKRFADIPRLRRLAIDGYLLLADGGRSFGRPALAWLMALAAGFVSQTLALVPEGPAMPSPNLLAETLRLSFASALVVGAPVFDPRRLQALEEAVHDAGGIDGFPLWLQLAQLAHAGFSALCLFLMALAIRNWLRLR